MKSIKEKKIDSRLMLLINRAAMVVQHSAVNESKQAADARFQAHDDLDAYIDLQIKLNT